MAIGLKIWQKRFYVKCFQIVDMKFHLVWGQFLHETRLSPLIIFLSRIESLNLENRILEIQISGNIISGYLNLGHLIFGNLLPTLRISTWRRVATASLDDRKFNFRKFLELILKLTQVFTPFS